ncbi:MAG TPA: glutathione S-transferase family protein [Solirubrobacteraceae bacterium]|nr:glutathione S-transferase family protein [Solirubrobacteraceae bacterium]
MTAADPRRTPCDVTLYTFPGSHSGWTAELMLAHKGMSYETVITPRGKHLYLLPAYGFRGITVPALTIGGRRLQTTRVISRALDMWQPEPRLFPSDPRRRSLVEDAECWGEGLQNAVRRLMYCATRRTSVSVLGALGSIRHRASHDAGRRDAMALPERLAQIDAWIEAGVLGGGELNAADFQIATSVAVLLSFADFAPHIAGRPAAVHAMRVAGEYERGRGPVLPDDWLAPLRSAAG